MKLTCAACGEVGERCSPQALYCMPCIRKPRPRIASKDRVRGGDFRRLRIDGKWCCVDCKAPLKVCTVPGMRCYDCSVVRYRARKAIVARAGNIVRKAVEAGDLQKATQLACTDCGKPATQYDHRDYTQPLKVDPVCRSCNVMRGPADVWPELASAA